MPSIPLVTRNLLILNIILFIAKQFLPLDDLLSLHFPTSIHFQPYQFVTHMFMHANLMHIFFNMFALISFGGILEKVWGAKRFFMFYIISGFGAAIFQLAANYYEYYGAIENIKHLGLQSGLLNHIFNLQLDSVKYGHDYIQLIEPYLKSINFDVNKITEQDIVSMFKASGIVQGGMLGASGAIYGIMVGFTIMFPNAELMIMFIPFPIKAKILFPIIILSDLFSGFTGVSLFGGGNVAHFAHVGGAITGLILFYIWKKKGIGGDFNRWN
ncbi:MAG: rhomboid family intramembrane serine protease [Saprospiraceae bacterium]|nr:rhomboid family intramembrane serine protease [Saprospiraceae bacterium]